MRNDYFIKSETDIFVFSASVDSVIVNSSLPLTNQHFYRHPIPIPEFQGNKKENKGNQNQTTDVKEPILILQEISSWIIIRKAKGTIKLINQRRSELQIDIGYLAKSLNI